ncbi:glutamyl-tRNA reductase [Desemzia sp. RIT804]|uniref:glutamyl-tRNA reductase n=1 Tax=Desemzia sp. RIT 804 TaxID=2810209 RepID=UPI001950D03E|nr:glutamyl-tRNA reductase [Desemzia sp. RIT 804]MBM6613932.1 glutamyl-tRNA reductase [Desemzia sp. RIT 804]
MKILLYGVNHHCAPIEIRENYAIEESCLNKQLSDIHSFSGIKEVAILTTCNRTEYYLYVDPTSFKHGDLLHYIADYSGYDVSQVISTTYGKSNLSAATHLFNVASGLDSAIVGESQILGQVKNAYHIAQMEKTVGPILSSLFNKAVAFSKKMHTVTKIDQVSRDAASAAVQLFKQEWKIFSDKRFLIIGAGKMAQSAAKALVYQGAESVTIASRNYEKTQEVVAKLNEWSNLLKKREMSIRTFHTGDYSHLPMSLAKADGIITATKSNNLIITTDVIKKMNDIRFSKKNQMMMDLSVPRNIETELGMDKQIFLFDMDRISSELKSSNQLQEKELNFIKSELEEAIYQFNFWFQERKSVPYLTEFSQKNNQIKESVMMSLQNKLPELTEHEVEVIQKHMQSVVNQLSKKSIQSLKDMAKTDSAEKAEREMNRFAVNIGLREEKSKEDEKSEKEDTETKEENKAVFNFERKEVFQFEKYH